MPFETYLVNKFEHTHENEFFRKLYHELKRRYSYSEGRHVLIGNVSCGGYDLDAIFITNKQITILEFKDYGGKLKFSENGSWEIQDGTKHIIVKGGANNRNPFQQVQKYRIELLNYLQNNHDRIIKDKNKEINWSHIDSIVLFSQPIDFNNNTLPPPLRKYFFIADFNTLLGRLEDKTSLFLRLSNNEISNILRVLGIKPEFEFVDDKAYPNNHAHTSLYKPQIELVEKLLPQPEEIKETTLKRILQYYHTIVNLERHKEPQIRERDLYKYAIDWNKTGAKVSLNLSVNSDFYPLFMKNLQKRFPENLFVGINVKTPKGIIPVLYDIIHIIDMMYDFIHNHDNSHNTDKQHFKVPINLDEFQLFVKSFEDKLDIPEDRLEELQAKVNSRDTLAEKLRVIKDFIAQDLNMEATLQDFLFVGLSSESKFSIQLLSEIRRLIYYDESKFDFLAKSFILNDESFLKKSKLQYETAQEDEEIIPITPLNEPQRKAIKLSFKQPLTVITGPPGTGKSQVVINIIANAILKGKTVLFASKNNKAIDTVKERVDALFQEKYLIRFGARQEVENRAKPIIKRFINQKNNRYFTDRSDILEKKRIELRQLQKTIESIKHKLNRIDELNKEIESLEEEIEKTNKNFKEWKEALEKDYLRFFVDNDYDIAFNTYKLALIRRDLKFYNKNFLTRLLFNIFAKNKIRDSLLEINESLHPEIAEYLQRKSPLIASDKPFITSFAEYTNLLVKLREDSHMIKTTKNSFLSKIEQLTTVLKHKKNELNHLMSEQEKLKIELAEAQKKEIELGIEYLNAFINHKLFYMSIPNTQRYLDFIPDRIPWDMNQYTSFEAAAKGFLHDFSAICLTSLSVKNSFPLTSNLFDILIIDEASQCDIASAIPLIYRSKQAVIIGDPMQLIHITNVHKEEEKYILEYLKLEDKRLDYIDTSLWDFGDSLAKRAEYKSVFLDEHYRCHSEIIRFSNEHFYIKRYGQALKIKTDSKKFQFDKTGIFWVNVKGNVHEQRNENKTEVLIAIRLAKYLHKKYPDASIGIVTPFKHQNELVFQEMDDSLRSTIQVDTVHKYQGDEKDIIICSLVVTDGCKPSLYRFINERAQNLINVAITRARGALYIVGDWEFCYSLNETLLSNLAIYVKKLNKVIEPEEVESKESGS